MRDGRAYWAAFHPYLPRRGLILDLHNRSKFDVYTIVLPAKGRVAEGKARTAQGAAFDALVGC
jgi:hypothetical protein